MRLFFHRLRFHFRLKAPLRMQPGTAANRIRGGLGRNLRSGSCIPSCTDTHACPIGRSCLYGQLFEPAPGAGGGPSGLAEVPRPFVLRPSQLERHSRNPADTDGGKFVRFDLHLFDMHADRPGQLVAAFARFAIDGLSEPWGAELASVEQLDLGGRSRTIIFNGRRVFPAGAPLELDLDATPCEAISTMTVQFLTPTEIKGGFAAENPIFGALLGRVRDRVATLARIYSGWEPGAETANHFRALGEQARTVEVAASALRMAHAWRTSGRTGEQHSLGGVIGLVEYRGDDLRLFLPWLRAAYWTGVGRHTSWGKGEIRLVMK